MSQPTGGSLSQRFVDQPQAVRSEDALELDRLLPWLREHIPDLPDGEPRVAQYPGGASNITYALDFGNRTLILRRPPFGTRPKSGHDMGREYRVMSGLHGHFPVPEPLAASDAHARVAAACLDGASSTPTARATASLLCESHTFATNRPEPEPRS